MPERFLKYLIPAALAFLFAILLWQIQRDRVSLDYETIESAALPREQGIGKYFVVRLRNSGNRQIEHIVFEFRIDVGAIESISFAEERLVSNLRQGQRDVKGSVPLLNPGETVSLTATVRGTPTVSAPGFIARAPGATAVPRSNADSDPWLTTVMLIVIVAVLAITYSLYASYRSVKVGESIAKIGNIGEISERLEKSEENLADRLNRIREERAEQDRRWEEERREREKQFAELERERIERARRYDEGEPQPEQRLFAILNGEGLGHRFAEAVHTGEAITYWRVGLRLLHWFLLDEATRDNCARALERITNIEGLQPSSLGFNLYLLAKMEQYRGNSRKAMEWFDNCRAKTPLMYHHLMAQDPAYTLESACAGIFPNSHRGQITE